MAIKATNTDIPLMTNVISPDKAVGDSKSTLLRCHPAI
jgi:hypothetical protein